MNTFDVIVVGGGHAGVEASYASARLGCKTLLITLNIENIAHMSCNPSIGGQAKSHLVREIDIFGGLMGKAADYSAIQYRVLNRKKGPAVQSTRCQCDKYLYKKFIQNVILATDNLTVWQTEAIGIIEHNCSIKGLVTKENEVFLSPTIVITTGTFLKGKIHIGQTSFDGGRIGDLPSMFLSNAITDFGHTKIRLKTGTPVRISKDSINFAQLEPQPGETDYVPFSLTTKSIIKNQLPCYITYTSEKTHDTIKSNINLSPMYGDNKTIIGVGPRYCPSIEDKIIRFSDKDRHQIFLEPEGWDALEYYPNGISTSLPIHIQRELLQSIQGLENCKITKPAYAIEYDAFYPHDLKLTLESKHINGLFLAGQINGTSGYEEAGVQGLIAGINAAIKCKKSSDQFILYRNESYAGVLIDDLITKSIDEPYRMFTSRAEHRLSLRENNIAERLIEKSFKYNLIDEKLFNKEMNSINQTKELISYFKNTIFYPTKENNEILVSIEEVPANKPIPLSNLFKRPTFNLEKASFFFKKSIKIKPVIWDKIFCYFKYEELLEKENSSINSIAYLEQIKIPSLFDFNISGITKEIQDKLKKYKPENLLLASKISGITPAAISIILMKIKNKL